MAKLPFPVHVVAVIDKNGLPITDSEMVDQYEGEIYEIVISMGSVHGITDEMRFIIYEDGDELFDPSTKTSLGRFEIVKGQARVTHLQDKMSKLRTSNTKRVPRSVLETGAAFYKSPSSSQTDFKTVAVPFRGIKIGDKARPI